jgi:hypothetical protein
MTQLNLKSQNYFLGSDHENLMTRACNLYSNLNVRDLYKAYWGRRF